MELVTTLRRALLSIILVIGLTTVLKAQTKIATANPPAPQTEAETAFDEFTEQLRAGKFKKIDSLEKREIEFWRNNFYAPLKSELVNQGDRLERLRQSTKLVFEIHGAENQCSATLVSSKIPTVLTWKLTFVTFTTRDLELLTDDEIAALAAHEIGHLYYTDDLLRARTGGDHRLERITELKADLIALTTLKLLKISPNVLMSAVRKLIDAREAEQLKNFQPGSPSIANRQAVTEKFAANYKNALNFNNPFVN